MVLASKRTKDGLYLVLIHERQVAELCEAKGALILRGALHEVADELVRRGYGLDDLVEESAAPR